MSTFLRKSMMLLMSLLTSMTFFVYAQQVPNAGFEDWSGAKFGDSEQPAYWHASNVEQVGMKFNFAHKEAGHNGGYCMMVQDQEVGAMGITETSPGYFSLGNSWLYFPGITNISGSTAGTEGGINWTYRPDTMSVWIKRTGNNTDKEDFYMIYYAWKGQSQGDKYKNKGGGCSSTTHYDEESDIRQALNANPCGTTVKANQIAEGFWCEKKSYGDWTNIRVPIYYFNNDAPDKVNLLFSASNYPNGGSASGLYAGNSLYVDDIELIYSAKIQKLIINDMEWKGFDPNSTDVQYYALGESATAIPAIEAKRGAGAITNANGLTANFPGRTLSGSEITINKGDLDKTPTTITVKSADGKSTMTYKIQFQKAASSNAKLAGISYTLDGKTTPIADFSPAKYNYTVDLPFGTTAAPVLSADPQEDGQSISITQPTSPTGTAKIVVTAPNKQATATYNLTFRVAALADNTLKDIKVNGNSIPGFNPSQAVYKVSLPTSTKTLTVEPVSAYPAGMQNIVITPNPLPSGDAINGATVQISVTTEGNTVAKVYKLNIKLEASSYSYLKNLEVEGYPFDFDPEQFTYYVRLPLGTTSLPAIHYTPGDEYQTIEMTSLEPGVVDGTVRITVTAGNGDQSVYKLVFSAEKSEISTLKGITIGGEPLEGFSPDITNYSYTLPEGTTELPEIVAIPGDEFQTITITTGGVNGKTRITVTAGNGSTTIYQISFSVKTYTDNTLKSLSVEGFDIGFEPEKNDYYVNLPQGTTTLPEVTYELQSTEFQTVRETKPSSLNGDYKITVRPQTGASRTYVIHFSLNKSSNTALNAIYLDGELLPGFHPDTLHYIDSLPEGVSRIPSVTFDKAESGQRVLSVLEGTTQLITVTAESGATREYSIEFIVRISQNAFLDMIYLDGDSLPGFERETLKYEVELTGDRCPAITVDKAAGQQVTITAPYAAGVAQIKVQPGAGAANTYLITLKAQATVTNVQLSAIRVNGTPIEGFDPATYAYKINYQGERPLIEGVAANEGQQVSSALWRDTVAWIYVTDAEENQAAYSVACHRQQMTNNTLKAIYQDGTLLPDFDPVKTDYTYELEPGTDFPEISYATDNAAQVVFFGQTAEGVWTIKVAAENDQFSTYTVRYTIQKRTDATLADLQVEGHEIDFAPAKTDYALTIDEGATLPSLHMTLREGQRVISYNDDADHQRILVSAESGAEKLYTISYSRKMSTNALLADILLEGKRLEGFEPEKLNYAVTLPKSTKTVPNIFPVAQLDNQTITTFFSNPNGVTKIHVVAQDGTTEKDYTIAFNVALSTNTKLGSLKINGETKDVDETEYDFLMPYGATQPYSVEFTKAEEEQLIDFTEANLSGVTRITVKAQNGDTRTYTIRYRFAEPEGDHKITNVKYNYLTADLKTVDGEIEPIPGENIIDLPFGAKTFNVTKVNKAYEQQSVIFYNGGIRRGAKIIVSANRAGEEDLVYTIVPRIQADTIGKLKELYYIKAGETIPVPHFDPDVYDYIIPVKEQPTKETLVGKAFGTKSVTIALKTTDIKEKKMTAKVGNKATDKTYTIHWYYEDDKDPFDFSGSWVDAGTTGSKPSDAWTVIADKTAGHTYEIAGYPIPYTTGLEVSRSGDNAVLLSSIRQAAIRATVPGMMTLGTMDVTLADGSLLGCNSTSSVGITEEGGTQFRNTPDKLTFQYNAMKGDDINDWSVKVWTSSGTAMKLNEFNGTYASDGLTDAEIDLTYPSGNMARINATLNSCGTEDIKSMGGLNDNQNSRLLLQNMHLAYNSELTSVTVDGKATTKTGNVFSIDVEATYVGEPVLLFSGKVPDQTRTVEWLHDGEWKDGKLTARVINYGENLADSTHYYVVLNRAAVTSLDYQIKFGNYPTKALTEDTTIVTLPYGMKTLPDDTIIPTSTHQHFVINKNGKALSVTVTAENGNSKTHVYVFRENLSSDATLEAIYANDGDIALIPLSETADTTILTMTVETMPEITYEHPEGVLGQNVVLTYTPDSALILVTAADATKQHTYILRRITPTVVTNAELKDFRVGSEEIALGGTKKDLTMERPTSAVFFSRKFDTDSVVFIQDETKMQWIAYGSAEATNTYTLTYPTEVSDKATLSALRVNGADYPEFSESLTEYTIMADSAILLETVAAEKEQTLKTTVEHQADSTIYSTEVTAADGTHKQTYKVIVHPTQSTISTLEAISYEGKRLEGFRPDSFAYSVIIPAKAYKTEQPRVGSITYEAGQQGQTIEMMPSLELNVETEIIVTAEDGSKNTYKVTVQAEPSHCADLTGITIDGKTLSGFETGRHFYSVSRSEVPTEIELLADDRFQTIVRDTVIVKDSVHYRYGFEVTAEDALTKAKYELEVYVENSSNDAQLANITLDGKNFVDFERALNSDLTFDPGNNLYTINLPAGTTTLPEVSAQLKMDGQSVDIAGEDNVIVLKVTAVDGKTTNNYTLRFVIPQSKNANLSMIFVNGDSLLGFAPDLYFYQIELPVGTHELPEIVAQKAEAVQTFETVTDTAKLQTIITVQAEDKTTRASVYTIVFRYTLSDADTLAMIYADGDSLPGFRPALMYYTFELPVGTQTFPTLDYEMADEWQNVALDTVESTAQTLIRQFSVIAESGKKNVYTVSYTILQSMVDTLQMILIDQIPMPGFIGTQNEYFYTLSIAKAEELDGELPAVDYIEGDPYQTVVVTQAPDSVSGKSLNRKSLVTVTAQGGGARTYTIHYLIELSSDAAPEAILLNGEKLANFDAERFTYKLELERDASLPAVSVVKKEEAQTYEIQVLNDTINVIVWAENKTSLTYTLVFERLLSDNTQLRDIILRDSSNVQYSSAVFPFRPDVYEYPAIELPYSYEVELETLLPSIEVVKSDSMQTVDTTHNALPNGDIQIDITVTAPNGEDQAIYTLLFHFVKPSDATLAAIMVRDALLEGFAPTTTEYTYVHPFGTIEADYLKLEDVFYELSDVWATATASIDEEHTIFITVVAQDETTEMTYVIRQTVGKDNDARLAWITLDSVLIADFDPDVTFYTYFLREGAPVPAVEAQTMSVNAQLSIREVSPGDTCVITCIAEDETKERYYIYFAVSQINDGLEPSATDVIVKRIPGTNQIMIGSLRKGVSFVMYDANGNIATYIPEVPTADPNDAEVYTNADNQEVLNDITDPASAQVVEINIKQPYFYSFYDSKSGKVRVGKIMLLQ